MTSSPQRRLLLSSVCQPFGEKHGDGFGVSFEGSHQLMWAQGIFRSRGTTTQWGIDFIAENLKIPTTTLHYPTMKRFIKEIKKGYDYIGIAFVATTLHKMIPMIEAIRKHAPNTKIILGGYGTALGERLEPYADYICKGEGVAFMRELLGEPVDAPIVQPVITQQQSLFSMPLLGKVGYVFAGLGCPNGCDFCATSHYFKRKHIRFLPDGPSILNSIKRLRRIYPDMVDIWISDEDFLLNQTRGRGFLEAIRQSDVPPLALSVFSSVKALSKYKVSELVEMGIDWIWVGYEGKRAGYSKMEGRSYKDLFADLHAHGISVLASMIVGFDYQTPEIIQEEFEELMSLRPSMCQFLIYGPAHGTPAYERIKAEGRFRSEVMDDYTKQDGFYLAFEHPNISADDMVSIQRDLYRKEFERLGPSVFRVVDDWVTGYTNMREHPAERVRAKAEWLKKMAHRAQMLLPGSKRYLSPSNAARIEQLHRNVIKETGPLTTKERLTAKIVPAMMRFTAFKDKYNIGRQPEFTSRSYRMGKPAPSLAALPQPLDTKPVR